MFQQAFSSRCLCQLPASCGCEKCESRHPVLLCAARLTCFVPSQTGGKGFGLFATRNIKKGEFLVEYVGEVINSAMKEVRMKEYIVSIHCWARCTSPDPTTAAFDERRKDGICT